MPRYIDADASEKAFCEGCSCYGEDYCDGDECCMIKVFREQPTADVEPVIYGHWIYGECGNDKYIKCSFCRKIIVNNIVTLEGDIAETAFVLCPYCGAKMDGGDGK